MAAPGNQLRTLWTHSTRWVWVGSAKQGSVVTRFSWVRFQKSKAAHVVRHLLDSASAEWALAGSEEGLGGQRQRMKSGTVTGENRGSLTLLLYEGLQVFAASRRSRCGSQQPKHIRLWEQGRVQMPPLELACKTWGPGLEQIFVLWRTGFLRED